MREIYLAGGCFWGLQEVFSRLPGVISTEVGYANSRQAAPSYEDVCTDETGAAETVKVTYDPQKIALTDILHVFFAVIDPYSKNRQGNDIGSQYRTGVYYTDPADEPMLEQYFNRLRQRGQEGATSVSEIMSHEEQAALGGKKMQTELLPLENFYTAEEEHQNYLKKHPQGYCHINLAALERAGLITAAETKE